MPSVDHVRPKIWEEVIPLFDNSAYSAIWGRRENMTRRSLGVRWNGDDDYVGYPNQGRNPVWFSEPEFLQRGILLAILDDLTTLAGSNRRVEFIENVLIALEECGTEQGR